MSSINSPGSLPEKQDPLQEKIAELREIEGNEDLPYGAISNMARDLLYGNPTKNAPAVAKKMGWRIHGADGPSSLHDFSVDNS